MPDGDEPDVEHLWCSGCESNPTYAQVNGNEALVCHCTHVDGELEPVLVHGFDTMPSRWSYRPETPDGTETVQQKLDRLDDFHDTENPDVLLFRSTDGEPVVARVDGEYRYLSAKLVYACRCTIEDVEAAAADDDPEVVSFSDVGYRSDRSSFYDLHPEVSDDD